MHNFIGRPYKERLDVSNIEEYYIKNNGNFYLAIDVKSDKIVGSIAIENRNKYGILKRFYVDKEYQKLGIGNRLYKIFDNSIVGKSKLEKDCNYKQEQYSPLAYQKFEREPKSILTTKSSIV